MRGDFSRDTFRPARHHSGVRLQQGRVLTDADWNEQADITRHRIEREAADVIGSCGAPEAAAGFAVSAITQALGVFALGDDAWSVGEDGVIVSTLDGGTTWLVHDGGTTLPLRAVHFATPSVGWAVGDGGTILKTSTGGASWAAQASGTTAALRAVFALTTTQAWAVGDDGTLLRTTNGGTTWTRTRVGTGRLYGVRLGAGGRGWLVGQGGQLATTEDAGATWTMRESTTSAHLRALSFASATVGWAVGEGGTVVRTTDGGLTWAIQATPVTARLHGVSFSGTTRGWAVGDDGVAVRTIDGGTTWARIDVGTGATLRGVSVASDTLGWIVGDDSVAVRIGTDPLAVSLRALPRASLALGAGRLYVDGVLCELETRTSFYAQPDRRVTTRLPTGTHVVYLDVWQRYLSHLEDPAIREVALGGPDTAGRSQTVWQARTLSLEGSPPSHCLSEIPELDTLVEPPRMRARAEPAQIASSVCEIGASAGFRRLENQLYRVEVHAAGGTPSFRWSRENGSVAYAILSIVTDPVKGESVVTLASRGLDDNLDLGVGDWVEIVDDDTTLEHAVGPLFPYLREGNDPREIVLQGLVPAGVGRDVERHPLLRRWEQKPVGGAPGTLPIETGKWIELEEGVQVWFEPGGTYRPGDHWLIPARTITGDVEWPRDEHGEPLARPPHGIEHRFCRLAIVEADLTGELTVVSDCRELFPPLTALTQLLVVSGDGQDGLPGVELPQPLRVRVTRGSHPVAGARVLFAVESGAGQLVGAAPGVPLDVPTTPDGVAAAQWVLDPDPAPGRRYQRVRASLLDAADDAVPGQAVAFCATATVTLQYAGGDGQEATAGQPLAHPLRVRVSNGQRPVAGARVGFRITGNGSLAVVEGQLVSSAPTLLTVRTDPQGRATVSWQLGATGLQRVEAELLDLAGNAIQTVVFGAAFRPQATTTTGCCVTVGEGGDVPRLDAVTLRKLLERFGDRVCLCFVGDEVHTIEDLDGAGTAHVALHGCGPGTRLRVDRVVTLSQFASFELAHLSVTAGEDCGLAFLGCGEVRVSALQAEAVTSPKQPVLRFGKTQRQITVSECRVRTKTGLGIVFDDVEPVTRLVDSEVEGGVVSFYGDPDPAFVLTPDVLRQLAARLKDVAVQPAPGQVFLSECRLQAVVIGRPMIQQLRRVADGQATLPGVFRAGAVQANVIADPGSAFVSRTLTLTSCSFLHESTAVGIVGAFVAETATAVGNLTVRIAEAFPLWVVTKPGQMQLKTANAAFVQP